MKKTRANRAADKNITRAVRNVAGDAGSTAENKPIDMLKVQDAPAPASRQPLLLRLQPRTLFRHDDSHALQPRLGASVVVGRPFSRTSEEKYTVWLPAAVWEGIGSIIRQTPRWHRPGVAEFLEVLVGELPADDGIAGLLYEMVDEVRDDPYGDVPEDPSDEFDFAW
jgi:hypothetical protein